MSDIFREVEEDLRRERAEQLWKKYGGWVIGAAVALVVAIGATSWWQAHKQAEAERAARAYAEAARLAAEDKLDEAIARFQALAAESGDGYRTVANLRAAALLAQKGERDAAVALFDAVATQADDPTLKDLAALRAAMTLLDVASQDELEVRLAPLARPGRPWRHTAREFQAFAALRGDDRVLAAERYRELTQAKGVPPLSRERARTMLRALQTEGVAPPAREVAPGPADAADAPAAEEPSPVESNQ